MAFTVASLVVGVLFLQLKPAQATFNGNNLMDDVVMDGVGSMNASQIDSWLNAYFPSSCISSNSGFEAKVPSGYSPGGGYTYGNFGTAGQVISAASQAYGLNPRVLLVTLEKEQSLISGRNNFSGYCNNGDEHKYAAAVGYGCPDGGTVYNWSGVSLYRRSGVERTSTGSTCVNTAIKAGFSQQVIRAAWLLKFGQQRSKGNTNWAVIKPNWDNSDDLYTCYGGPMTQGSFKRCPSDSSTVYYDGYITIDGTATHMDSGATAALYWYTPHFHGNQNFVSLYEGWFGKTTGPDYAWSINSFTYNPTMGIGQTQTVTLKATNTGRLPWYNQNAAPSTPTRVGTWGPNRGSPFYTGSWINSFRPSGLVENVVQPGEDGTFTFQITAPNTTGTYVEGFNLLMENYLWFPSVGFSPTITVVRPYQWQVNSVTYGNGTGYMNPGSTQTVTVKALNTGTATWYNSGGEIVKLGTWEPGRQSKVASGWINSARPTSLTEASVAPGQIGTFTFNVYMPDSGMHYERLNLVAEGTAWFNDIGLTLYLQGTTYAWQPVWYSPSTGNWSIPRNTSFTITIKARNTGTATWTKDGNFPVRLGTNPPGRGTALESPSWINSIRPTGLIESSVAPGQEGTFTFIAKTPNVTGMRYEAFNLVAEGILWFKDPGFAMNVNVL